MTRTFWLLALVGLFLLVSPSCSTTDGSDAVIKDGEIVGNDGWMEDLKDVVEDFGAELDIPKDSCTPNCEGKVCGDDGCGGNCGECGAGAKCTDSGQCQADCESLCANRQCGTAGSDQECDCGECDAGLSCINGQCLVNCDDVCALGECTPKWAEGTCNCGSCNDDNACTEDTCTDEAECVFTATDGAPCNDQDPCTSEDTCVEDQCVGTPTDCQCLVDDDCTPLEDDDLCNGTLYCDTSASNPGICAVDETTVVECPLPEEDDPDAPCLDAQCEAETGECSLVPTNEGGECESANLCTQSDTCKEGICIDGDAVDCDDLNPCTDDSCDSQVGCINSFNTEPCDDLNPCTVEDFCSAGECLGSGGPDCDDLNPCTDDSCDPENLEGCIHTNNQEPCSDDNACTVDDACFQGSCVPGPGLDCDDENPCTDDNCDPGEGCSNVLNAAPCDDGDPCTAEDTCSEGVCQGTQSACDDLNPCTEDTCDGGTCFHTYLIGPCNDNNACTVGDSCIDGACVAGPKTNCDDNNHCTTDSCDPLLGCLNTPNSLPCNDGDACTTDDQCVGGNCQGLIPVICNDNNQCTANLCDGNSGCIYTPLTGPCDDADPCTQGDTCSGGQCVGTDVICDDSNPCTVDWCQPGIGCQHTNNTGNACSDGDLCTTNDQCDNGLCVGAQKNCNDNNPCTDDLCDSAVGCTHAFNTAPCDDLSNCTIDDTCDQGQCIGIGTNDCDDDNPCTRDICLPDGGGCEHEDLSDISCDDLDTCTENDMCVSGVCTPGDAIDCDDNNTCTEDSCEAGECLNSPITGECADGNACTLDDACMNGICVPGNPADCNDQNPCTKDWCDPLSGCQHEDLTSACDDGNACTDADQCVEGTCVPGSTIVCNDNNPCTDDACDPQTGCISTPNAQSCDDENPCTVDDACTNGACIGNLSDCDDSNPCTEDWCDPASGCKHDSVNGPCTDGDPCTTGDTCSNGACLPGTAVVCDDENPCTDDACVNGTCVFTPNDDPCDDGNACTEGDFCGAGECLYTQSLDCNDLNSCTTDSCNPTEGCVHVNNTQSCNDLDLCTNQDSCSDGECVGVPATCNDSNPCTTDSCDPTTGCVNAFNTDPCDDYNNCTTDDVCNQGICQGTGSLECDDLNPCTQDVCLAEGGCDHVDLSGLACSDGNACTENDQCVDGSCVPGNAADCNDNNVCTADSCDPDTGCVNAPNEQPCDDGSACTENDICAASQCSGIPIDCTDASVCTEDSCDPTSGCVHTPISAPCSDSDPCTIGDTCMDGVCTPTSTRDCDDSNDCTTEFCDSASGQGCVYTELDSGSCDDGNICTEGDTCSGGVCVGTQDVDCEDGNPCTTDYCLAGSGCLHAPNTEPCDDNNLCTDADTCGNQQCQPGNPVVCNDNNPCTTDSCDPDSGCVFANNTLLCDDNNECTSGDTCIDGACAPGAAITCNDNNICTTDSCSPASGCVFNNNSIPCDDGNLCTTSDRCANGACVDVVDVACDDNNVCTTDSCDPASGCVFDNNTLPCNDNNECTVDDTCSGGICTGTGSNQCDDLNPCTIDICNPDGTCDHSPVEGSCSDGDPCTTNDYCSEGTCIPGNAVVCNDSNPCTDDACNDGVCTYTANSEPCDDGNACTTGDTCSNKACVPTSDVDCNDNNVCTTDSCDPASGCVLTHKDGDCDDNNACTTGDTCVNSTCTPTTAVNCNDNNVCTTDSCNADTGCVHTNNDSPCDDSNACTENDTCLDGICQSTTPVDCADEYNCTVDSCSPNDGCHHAATDSLCAIPIPCYDYKCDPGNDLAESDGCVFTLLSVDCVMGPWSPWSTCTANCGGGTRTRTRSILVEPSCDGAECGVTQETEDCNTDPCPQDCQWHWSDWSTCEGNCPTGTQSRVVIVDADPVAGGAACPTGTEAVESQLCSLAGTSCTDLDVCTTNDTCTESGCEGDLLIHIPIAEGGCDHEDECVIDSCTDDGSGTPECSQTSAAVQCVGAFSDWSVCSGDGVTCDGTRSKTFEISQPSSCGGTPCDFAHGEVVSESCNVADSSPCEDGSVCTLNDSCLSGECIGGSQVTCADDGNVCTTEYCDPDSGCLTVNNGIDCDDGNPCTNYEYCRSGTCGNGKPVICEDDGNVCTTESCNPNSGCESNSNTEPCDDSNPCTTGDTCDDGECISGAATECSDSYDCTVDSCNTSTGCVNAPDDSLCPGNDPCYTYVCDPTQPTADVYGCLHIPAPVDCVLGDWGEWSECTAECGGGTQTRIRPVVTQASCGGAACGEVSESQECNTEICSVDCQWHWSEWAACEGTCPDGTQTRTVIVDADPVGEGAACPTGSEAIEGQDCSLVGTDCVDDDPCTMFDTCLATGCAGTDAAEVSWIDGGCDDNLSCTEDSCVVSGAGVECVNESLAVDCSGSWSDWTACDAASGDCMGVRTRTFTITEEAYCGGASCEGYDGQVQQGTCGATLGTLCDDTDPCTENDVCNGYGVCQGTDASVDCVGEWSSWGECNLTDPDGCGGTAYRYYGIVTPASCGGADCYPEEGASESAACILAAGVPCDDDDPCTDPDTCNGSGGCLGIALPAVDCVGSVGTFGDCVPDAPGSCTGTRTATYTVTIPAECEGIPCPYEDGGDVIESCDMPKLTDCDDGNACTGYDSCSADGVCGGVNLALVSAAEGGCNDGDSCTVDACLTDSSTYYGEYLDSQSGDLDGPYCESTSGTSCSYRSVYGRIYIAEATEITHVGFWTPGGAQWEGATVGLFSDDNGEVGTLIGCDIGLIITPTMTKVEVMISAVSVLPGYYWVGIAPKNESAVDIWTISRPGTRYAYKAGGSSTYDCSSVGGCPNGGSDYVNDHTLNVFVRSNLDNTAHCLNVNQPVDCDGAWGAWSQCNGSSGSCFGTQSSTYEIDTPASCGGNSCSFADGTSKSQACDLCPTTCPAGTTNRIVNPSFEVGGLTNWSYSGAWSISSQAVEGSRGAQGNSTLSSISIYQGGFVQDVDEVLNAFVWIYNSAILDKNAAVRVTYKDGTTNTGSYLCASGDWTYIDFESLLGSDLYVKEVAVIVPSTTKMVVDAMGICYSDIGSNCLHDVDLGTLEPGVPIEYYGTTVGDTDDSFVETCAELPHGVGFGSPDDIYSFTIPTGTDTSNLKISVRSHKLTALTPYLLTNCHWPPTSCVSGATDNYPAGTDGQTTYTIQKLATLSAGTYYIVVDGIDAGDSAAYRLRVEL